jgi:hypothetical protein
VGRLAVAALVLAMACAAALLIWESRGLTLMVDEWSWGFGARTNLDLHAFVDPHNGHFVAVLVLITKVALQVFHANAALPLRLLAVALHLAVAGCLFLLMRQAVGAVAAVVPVVLVLFLGAANDGIVGSHGMSVTITVLAGLGAWLTIQRRTLPWDLAAAALLTIGVASESTVLPFIFAAALLIRLDPESTRSRYWIALFPFAVYVLWWLAWGHTEKSDFAIANLAGLPSFAFDSLAAGLASIAGVFTVPGSRTVGFDLSAGQALAGGLLVVTLALVLYRRYRPGLASPVPMLALLSFWLLTSSVASPARVPWSSRYLYITVILLLLVLAQEIGASPVRRQAAIALSAICAFALLPNIREIAYAGDDARTQGEINRAVMGAADLVAGAVPEDIPLEDPSNVVGTEVPDLNFSLETYDASKQRFGAPAFSVEQIEHADPTARGAADSFLARALPIEILPASRPPRPLSRPSGASQSGGVLKAAKGCLRFAPLASGAQLKLKVPVGGLWMRPAVGQPVSIGLERFGEKFGVTVGDALGGRASVLTLPPTRASTDWRAMFTPTQPLLLCGA